MKKKMVQATLLIMMCAGLYSQAYQPPIEMVVETPSTTAGSCELLQEIDFTIRESEVNSVGSSEEEIKEIEEVEVTSIPLIFADAYFDPETETYREEEFWDDMELVALVCVAEAEGESELGKRLVIDSIFNRKDDPRFPNTIHEIIYAPGQFECVWNGRINKVEYNEYIANLVIEEMNNRTNSEVIYFRTGYYFDFARPILHEGSHYFSGR